MTPEQQARDMMERAGWDGAQDCSAGDVVEIANLISDNERLTAELDRQIAVASALFDSLSEAERDSERYRWLKSKARWEPDRDMGPGGRWWIIVLAPKGRLPVDAAVDAERAPDRDSATLSSEP